MNKLLFFTLVSITLFSCNNNKYGCIEGDCQNGYGKILYTNGGTKSGNFINGKLNGYGVIVWGKGIFEGDTLKGYFVNGITKENGTLYKAAFDATFVGIFEDKDDMDYENNPTTGYFKVYFGKNSLWKGTFEGDFVNGTSKEWEERINIKHAKSGKYVAQSASLFLTAISCFSQHDAIQNCFEPLTRIYDKDLTTEIVSEEEIQEIYDSLQSQKKILMCSLLKLNQLEEFDKKIPVKGVLIEQFKKMLIRINETTPKLLVMFAQPPSKEKLKEIYYYNKSFDDEFEKIVEKYSTTYKEFENKYIIFYED